MIVPLTEAHARYVCEHIQDIERRAREIFYDRPFSADWYVALIMDWAKRGTAHACLKDGVPLVIGGVMIDDGVGTTWMVCTDRVNDVVIELTRASRKAIQRLKECGMIEKVVVSSIDFHLDAHRWYRLLGLSKVRETAGPRNHQIYVFEG